MHSVSLNVYSPPQRLSIFEYNHTLLFPSMEVSGVQWRMIESMMIYVWDPWVSDPWIDEELASKHEMHRRMRGTVLEDC